MGRKILIGLAVLGIGWIALALWDPPAVEAVATVFVNVGKGIGGFIKAMAKEIANK